MENNIASTGLQQIYLFKILLHIFSNTFFFKLVVLIIENFNINCRINNNLFLFYV